MKSLTRIIALCLALSLAPRIRVLRISTPER